MRARIPCVLLPVIMALVGCDAEQGNQGRQPQRLPSIPETATWAGGVDGGAWISCEVDESQSANWCTVWDDQTGEVSARTHFVLRDGGGAVASRELRFSGFTGTYIGLLDGRLLEPLKFHEVERDPWEPTPIEPPRDGGL